MNTHTMSAINAVDVINALDLEPIKVKLMHEQSGEGWSLARANAIEFEYRRFLMLMKKFPNEETAPLVDVDTFWHYHILDTMKYAADCDAVFGHFLHHFPYIGLRGEDDEAAHVRVGQRMRELYEAEFGDQYGRDTAGEQVAYSGVAAGATVAYSGAVGQTASTAYSGAVGQAAQTAYSGAVGKGAETAYSGAVGKTAYSGAVGKTAYSGAVGATAYSGAIGKTAYSGAVGKTAYSGSVGATAYSGSVGAGAQPGQAAAATATEAAIDHARQSSFYSERPRLSRAA